MTVSHTHAAPTYVKSAGDSGAALRHHNTSLTHGHETVPANVEQPGAASLKVDQPEVVTYTHKAGHSWRRGGGGGV